MNRKEMNDPIWLKESIELQNESTIALIEQLISIDYKKGLEVLYDVRVQLDNLYNKKITEPNA